MNGFERGERMEARDVFPQEIWQKVVDEIFASGENWIDDMRALKEVSLVCRDFRCLVLPAVLFATNRNWAGVELARSQPSGRPSLLAKAIREGRLDLAEALLDGERRYGKGYSPLTYRFWIFPEDAMGPVRKALAEKDDTPFRLMVDRGLLKRADSWCLKIAASRGMIEFLRWRHEAGDDFESTRCGPIANSSGDLETLRWFADNRPQNRPTLLCLKRAILDDDPDLLDCWYEIARPLQTASLDESIFELARLSLRAAKCQSFRWLVRRWPNSMLAKVRRVVELQHWGDSTWWMELRDAAILGNCYDEAHSTVACAGKSRSLFYPSSYLNFACAGNIENALQGALWLRRKLDESFVAHWFTWKDSSFNENILRETFRHGDLRQIGSALDAVRADSKTLIRLAWRTKLEGEKLRLVFEFCQRTHGDLGRFVDFCPISTRRGATFLDQLESVAQRKDRR